MKNTVLTILKIICAGFCGIMALGGAIAFLANASSEPDVAVLTITLIFLAVTISLVRSIRKSNYTKYKTGNANSTTYTYHPKNKSTPISPTLPKGSSSTDCKTSTMDGTSLICAPTEYVYPVANENQSFALFKRIPDEIFQLLWFSNGPFKNYSGNSEKFQYNFAGFTISITSSLMGEPSAIDVELPVSSRIAPPAPLDYYPSYAALTPGQRTAYLNWLGDITMPIDVGYVFIFYYGLERHLFFGNATAALATIFILRQFHENKSFQVYSGDAILLYALTCKKPEILQHLDIQQLSPDLRLFASAMGRHCLTAQDIIAAHKKFSFENTRYIKAEPGLFASTLECLLIKNTGMQTFEISLEDFQSAEGTFTLALANYSLLPAQRFLSLPDISTAPRIHNSVHSLLVETHESIKIRLRELRKQSNCSKNDLTK